MSSNVALYGHDLASGPTSINADHPAEARNTHRLPLSVTLLDHFGQTVIDRTRRIVVGIEGLLGSLVGTTQAILRRRDGVAVFGDLQYAAAPGTQEFHTSVADLELTAQHEVG